MNSRVLPPMIAALRPARRWLYVGLLCVPCVFSACEMFNSKRPTGKVTVSVTYGGKPVTAGSVQLAADANDSDAGGGAFGALNSEGVVVFPVVEVGVYKVAVMPPAPPDPDPTKPSAPQKPPADIPEKFYSSASTSLSAEVSEGDNDFDFDLKK